MLTALKIGPENLLAWGDFEDWESGASLAPTEYVLSGTNATIERESTIVKFGTYSAKVTRVGNDASLYYDFPGYADYLGKKMTFGSWVYATAASRARVAISDGVGTSYSSYHSGVVGWEWLTVTRNIDPSATRIRTENLVDTGNTSAYFDGGILAQGDTAVINLSDYMDLSDIVPATRYRSQTFSRPRRGGLIVPNFDAESQSMKMSGLIVGNDLSTVRTNLDTILKIINSPFKKPNGDRELRDLYLYDDRLIKVYATQIEPAPRSALKVRELDMRFSSPSPFSQFIQKLRTAQAISASPTTFTVTVNGSAPVNPIIKITAGGSPITTATIENLTTGQIFSYTGTIAAGESLILDCENLTIENDGAVDLANYSGEPAIELAPGANQIRFTGTTGGTVRIDRIDRWHGL